MKLLFDQNISFRILRQIIVNFPESIHVKSVNLIDSDDFTIWKYAKRNSFTIVTQDSDFNDFAIAKGFPPKIIWLKTGNMSTNSFADLLIELKNEILEFIDNSEYGIFEIHKRK